eukprot:100437-Prorocentrum_minimum.AAC.3
MPGTRASRGPVKSISPGREPVADQSRAYARGGHTPRARLRLSHALCRLGTDRIRPALTTGQEASGAVLLRLDYGEASNFRTQVWHLCLSDGTYRVSMQDEYGDGWDEGGSISVFDQESGGTVMSALCGSASQGKCNPEFVLFSLPYDCTRANGKTPVVANLTTGRRADQVGVAAEFDFCFLKNKFPNFFEISFSTEIPPNFELFRIPLRWGRRGAVEAQVSCFPHS